ncbi:uncharacterized protein N7515_000455, partial [Penicillium bovifimosum]
RSGKRRAHDTSSVQTRGFRGGHEPKPGDVFIAVMGVTGSGKSSFISICSGEPVEIGHSLDACTWNIMGNTVSITFRKAGTAKVDVYAYKLSSSRTVYLIDTPGFDDTNKKDTVILSEIATWLGDSYQSNILLHGIIYLHRITDVRMPGSAIRNLDMFRKLCGDDVFKKVILVTTMWDTVSTDVGVRRETQLKKDEKMWAPMVRKGSSCHRHNNTESSARDIIQLLAKHNSPIVTDIQRQLVDKKLDLNQTSAGQVLQSETMKEAARLMKELREFEALEREAQREKDMEKEEIMREEAKQRAEMIKKANEDMAALRANIDELLAQRDEREAQLGKRLEERLEREMQKRQASYDQQIQRLREEKKGEVEYVDEQEAEPRRQSSFFKFGKTKAEKRAEKERKAEEAVEQYWKTRQQSKSLSAGYSPYSVSMGRQLCALSGPKHYWCLDRHGIQNLEFCVLGPGQKYYARWANNAWFSRASDELHDVLEEVINRPNKPRIRALAFGYGNSYVLSFGSATGTKVNGRWGNHWNTKGYYPDLSDFLSGSGPLTILAVALDPHSTTDFILVYQAASGQPCLLFFCSDSYRCQVINNWWDKERGSSKASPAPTREEPADNSLILSGAMGEMISDTARIYLRAVPI